MAHAEKCPVCNGLGQLNKASLADTVAERWERCHGCSGKGWVEVQDVQQHTPPQYIWVYTPWFTTPKFEVTC